MKILLPTENLREIVNNMNIKGKESLLYLLRDFLYGEVGSFKNITTPHTYYLRLIDDSYGQFVIGEDAFIFSCGADYLNSAREYFGNCIGIFLYSDDRKRWEVYRNLIVDDFYFVKHIVKVPEIMRFVTILTRKYMKQFSTIANSREKVEALADRIKEIPSQKDVLLTKYC